MRMKKGRLNFSRSNQYKMVPGFFYDAGLGKFIPITKNYAKMSLVK